MSEAEDAFAQWLFDKENMTYGGGDWVKPIVTEFVGAVRGWSFDRLVKRRDYASRHLDEKKAEYEESWKRELQLTCNIILANIFKSQHSISRASPRSQGKQSASEILWNSSAARR